MPAERYYHNLVLRPGLFVHVLVECLSSCQLRRPLRHGGAGGIEPPRGRMSISFSLSPDDKGILYPTFSVKTSLWMLGRYASSGARVVGSGIRKLSRRFADRHRSAGKCLAWAPKIPPAIGRETLPSDNRQKTGALGHLTCPLGPVVGISVTCPRSPGATGPLVRT